MVLDKYRSKVDSILTPPAKAMARLGANNLSIISLVFAFLAAIILVFWKEPIVLIFAFMLVLLNGFFDAIDGKVARITNRPSPKGDLVDHVIDRYADFLIIAGISLSVFANTALGLVALGSVLLASYMGTQSQALGLGRDYGGILGRAERMLLFMLFLVLQFIYSEYGTGSFELSTEIRLTILDLLLIVFIFASNITVLQRFRRAWKSLP